jgi:TonB family protein
MKTTYQLTLIDNNSLSHRLLNEIGFMKTEATRFWRDFRNDPTTVGHQSLNMVQVRVRGFITAPNRISASLSAFVVMTTIIGVALILDRRATSAASNTDVDDQKIEWLSVAPAKPNDSDKQQSIGQNGTGRVGLREGRGEGSGSKSQQSGGGGSGGDHNPLPPQRGEVPPPSNVLAAIPIAPPINPPSLPVAGIDIDPALWTDLKQPKYGDPSSTSDATSKGPGDGGGIGTNTGLGIGNGHGPGFGPGNNGNTGFGDKQTGCCGPGGATGYNETNAAPVLRNIEVEQRVRVISKPEPQYTEEARRNQVTGTVMLRVVFSSLGEVTQIRAVNSLPFGLTERAIAAARQIKFAPATKGGRPVSVYMQLEYNFNLY